MSSERVQRLIDDLLDDVEDAVERQDWSRVLDLTDNILEVDPGNEDALAFETMAERNDEGEPWLGDVVRTLIGIAFVLSVYMLPTGIAMLRNKHNKMSIFALNLFLGWTFIGWVVALVWGIAPRGD